MLTGVLVSGCASKAASGVGEANSRPSVEYGIVTDAPTCQSLIGQIVKSPPPRGCTDGKIWYANVDEFHCGRLSTGRVVSGYYISLRQDAMLFGIPGDVWQSGQDAPNGDGAWRKALGCAGG